VSRAKLLCAVLGAVVVSMPSGSFRAAAEMQAGAPAAAPAARDLFVTVGKSLVVESPVNIQRISVGDSKKAEAMAVTPREVLVNGKEAGETSLIIWQAGGNRLLFDLRIRPSSLRLDSVREEMSKEVGPDVAVTAEGNSVFLRGTVDSTLEAERAVAIAATLGKPVNLLRVKVPAVDDQILLKVRFANIDRTASQDLGANLFSTGAGNTIGSAGTQQYASPTVGITGTVGISDALNLFLFRPDLNLGATIRALQARSLLEILAEPNVLTVNGKAASFLAGGEFPVPVVQSGIGGAGAVTIQWREFGIRINFQPTVTPRGTIRLKVAPEVSSLDSAHGIVISGFSVPALSTRRVQTEIELQDGQSFAIAGLLDNRVIESWNKIPGLAEIPIIGKLFQSRSRSKANTELLVMVTPELVRPIPAGQPLPDVKIPSPVLEGSATSAPRTPPMSVTGQVPVKSVQDTVPVELLRPEPQQPQNTPATPTPMYLVPVPQQTETPANPGTMTGPPPAPGNN
jgi:pilus assembly protein CpaC